MSIRRRLWDGEVMTDGEEDESITTNPCQSEEVCELKEKFLSLTKEEVDILSLQEELEELREVNRALSSRLDSLVKSLKDVISGY